MCDPLYTFKKNKKEIKELFEVALEVRMERKRCKNGDRGQEKQVNLIVSLTVTLHFVFSVGIGCWMVRFDSDFLMVGTVIVQTRTEKTKCHVIILHSCVQHRTYRGGGGEFPTQVGKEGGEKLKIFIPKN